MPEPIHLFVYGTLRKDARHPMALLLRRYAEHLGRGTFQGKLYDLGSYPGAVPSNHSRDTVVGDIFQLKAPERILPRLDAYEGCTPAAPAPHEYLRQALPVTLENGKSVLCWIYVYNRETARLRQINSGDYKPYL